MNEEQKLISIIVPVYNERVYLNACVQSIVNQTYANTEIIIVDDGSDEKTSNDCDRLAEIDGRIIVIHKKNEGLSAARITGLKRAHGEWVLFVDDDDLIVDYLLEVLIKFSLCKDVDIIAGGRLDSYNAEESLDSLKQKSKSFFENEICSGRVICNRIPDGNSNDIITPMWGKLYRRDFLNNYPTEKYKSICPTIFFEDILMTPLLYCACRKICIVHMPLYIHREVATSISRSGRLSSFYYEQIDSGNILLMYYKHHKMHDMYVYEITKYIRNTLRIWTLIDDRYEKKEELINKIKVMLKKYYLDYLRFGKARVFEKILYGFFFISPNRWKEASKMFYLARNKLLKK